MPHLQTLPPFPNGLECLSCTTIPLTHIPFLPPTLKECTFNNTHLNYLPTLPKGLEVLVCHSPYVKSLPPLPPTLKELWCFNKEILTLFSKTPLKEGTPQ